MSALVTLGVVVVAVLGLSVLVSYNRFVRLRATVDESWGDIDVELTRRHDLVPNLVAAVTAYAAHEELVLTAVTEARSRATEHRQEGPAARSDYELGLGTAVGAVLVRAEAYPALMANQNFLALQEQLTDTEDRIAAARRFYNGNVRRWNTRVSTVPSNLVAGMFSFDAREFFEADAGARSAPVVG